MRRRCHFMSTARSYGQPGRCAKVAGLRTIVYQGRKVASCAHHRATTARGRATIAATRVSA